MARRAATGREAAAGVAVRRLARAQADRRSEPPAPRCRRRFPAADWWWRSRRAPSSREARKAARICVEPEVRGCGKPEFRLYGKTASLPKLPLPVESGKASWRERVGPDG